MGGSAWGGGPCLGLELGTAPGVGDVGSCLGSAWAGGAARGAAEWGTAPGVGAFGRTGSEPCPGVLGPPAGGGGGGGSDPNAVCLFRYLKEFRTEQCSLFVRHKCTQHRPFTCFHWHFLNQRRRRPLRRRDGTFNYSPDVYCSKYDEASGVCPDGDE